MVRFEVSSSAAIASAVSGLRVRRSTWMIWNSRSARLMVVLFFSVSRTDADRMLAAGGGYIRDNDRRGFVHDDSIRTRKLPAALPASNLVAGAPDRSPARFRPALGPARAGDEPRCRRLGLGAPETCIARAEPHKRPPKAC